WAGRPPAPDRDGTGRPAGQITAGPGRGARRGGERRVDSVPGTARGSGGATAGTHSTVLAGARGAAAGARRLAGVAGFVPAVARRRTGPDARPRPLAGAALQERSEPRAGPAQLFALHRQPRQRPLPDLP